MTEKWDEMAVVGWIARAHGIRGQVIVKLETDFPEGRFRPGAKLFLNRAGAVEPLTVTTARFHRAFRQIQRTFARLKVPVVCAQDRDPVRLILARLERLRGLGIRR